MTDTRIACCGLWCKTFFQLFYKLLFYNDSFFVVSCFVLVVGDSFLIRSIKKFFCFGYLNVRACAPGCVCVRVGARVRRRVRVCVRVGVTFVQH